MSRNKNAMIRYRALDACFRRGRQRRYYIEDLIEACADALYDYNGTDSGVSRRQVLEDIKFMESGEGWSIRLERRKDGRRVYYRYADPDFSIGEAPLTDEEMDALRHTVATLRRFSGLPLYEWVDNVMHSLEYRFGLSGSTESIIGFEQCENLRGTPLLPVIVDAILHKRVLHVTYSAYSSAQPRRWTLHPYYLKQYNSRWFLFAYNPEFNGITNAPIDRIASVSTADGERYKAPAADFARYFDDMIGVSLPRNESDRKVEEVVLRFSEARFPYVMTKPMHRSQRITDESRREVTLSVVLNKELTARLLEFGADVEVVAPQRLRAAVRQILADTLRIYDAENGGNT